VEPDRDHQPDAPTGDGLTASPGVSTAPSPGAPPGEGDTAATFLAHRPMLFGLAYRMLGTSWDAEDVLQEAYLRWAGADQAAVRQPRRYLSRTVARLALDRLRERRAEPYPGPWLPEPVPADPGVLGPLDTVELRDSVSIATLHLLERLSPPERAVYVLRTAFELPYEEIAEIIERGPEHCRQLQHRAGERIGGAGARFVADPAAHTQLLRRFLAAARGGDFDALSGLLRADVVAWTDGGGKGNAARNPVSGRDRVTRFFAGIFHTKARPFQARELELGGLPAVFYRHGLRHQVLALRVLDGRIADVYLIANPDKLGSVR
jgi:RNA polymerase sigma-70 factor (ECF subfamily)